MKCYLQRNQNVSQLKTLFCIESSGSTYTIYEQEKRSIKMRISLFSFVLYTILYLSIPIIIRYLVLKRPIKRRFIIFIILIPIYLTFSFIIQQKRSKGQEEIYRKFNIPYENTSHMIGSPLLFTSMIIAYFILHKGAKNEIRKNDNETTNNKFDEQLNSTDILPKEIVCPSCGSELLLDDEERRTKKVVCPVCNIRISNF